VKTAVGVDLKVVAARTPGFVGADLANVVNEAALLAVRKGKTTVEIGDFDDAIDRVIAGLQKKTRLINQKEKLIVSHHETGHALNSSLVNSSALYSSGEAGAMDEAYADYWARTSNNNSKIGEWFLGAIEAALSITGVVRDASLTNIYPDTMVYEVHDDSRTFGEALWKIRQSIGANSADILVAQSLQMLPATARFADGVRALQDAANILGYSTNQKNAINQVLSTQGLIRQDTADSLQWPPLAGRPAAWVIDDHTFNSQAGGNCNATLDVGETAMVFFNLHNSNNAQKGVVALELVANSAGSSVVSGWNVGEYFRFQPSQDFLTALRAPGVSVDDATVAAAFMVSAQTSGRKNFTLKLNPMNGPQIQLPVYVDVGTAPTASSCNNSSLWP
jgi:hypothetical protein